MDLGKFKILIVISLFFSFSKAFSQVSEDLKVALTHKIANCVVWRNDTSSDFHIGILSKNQNLTSKFISLTKIAKVNKRNIKIVVFSGINEIKPVHLLYIDNEYNPFLTNIANKTERWNTLLVTEMCNLPGEIMMNLRIDEKTQKLNFEYNRANILFAGLDLTEQIVLLKGTEIEIRELYLRAKKLWDEQKRKADSLVIETEIKEKRLRVKSDSIAFATKRIAQNERTIQFQNRTISEKDSVSAFLHKNILQQNIEIKNNRAQLGHFGKELNKYLQQIANYQNDVKIQKNLSDSLSKDIFQKKSELAERKKILGEKDIIINKQSNWMSLLTLIIAIISILVFFILKAYITNKRAKTKIAEQKEELQSILEKLQNTQQQLINSEKMASLGVLVAGIAHEINNPINFINSGISGIEKVVNKMLNLLDELNKLKENSSSQEIKEFIEFKNKLLMQKSIDKVPEIVSNIKLGIDRTIAIIDGLRLYTHVDKEEKRLNDINQIIKTSLLLMKPKIKDQIAIETNFSDLPEIPVFPSKLSQVFINIISNAIDSVLENKDQSDKSIIQINTFKENNNIIVEISDTGAGIPNEMKSKIFDPFFTTKEIGKGTGLGLSISYGIIEEHNVNFYAKYSAESGAVFTIELPVNN